MVHAHCESFSQSMVEVTTFRCFGPEKVPGRGPYAIFVSLGDRHGYGGGGAASGYPVSRGVMDDFGTFVMTERLA
jgi:hypothetical protein